MMLALSRKARRAANAVRIARQPLGDWSDQETDDPHFADRPPLPGFTRSGALIWAGRRRLRPILATHAFFGRVPPWPPTALHRAAIGHSGQFHPSAAAAAP